MLLIAATPVQEETEEQRSDGDKQRILAESLKQVLPMIFTTHVCSTTALYYWRGANMHRSDNIAVSDAVTLISNLNRVRRSYKLLRPVG